MGKLMLRVLSSLLLVTCLALALLMPLLSGCGERTLGATTDGGSTVTKTDARSLSTSSDSALRLDAAARTDAAAKKPLPTGPCVLAIRVDDCCCPEVHAASVDKVQSDPCLVAWPPEPADVKACPKTCQAVCDCEPQPPRSRLVEWVEGVGCQLASECETNADCVVAEDTRSCCPCPQVVPQALIAQDSCLRAGPGPHEACATCPPDACAAVGACAGAGTPTCIKPPGVGPTMCRGVHPR